MTVSILVGDVMEQLAGLPDDHFDVVFTSPPYWGLRDYGVAGQLGLEPTLGEHLERMVAVFREVRRVLKPTGIVWLNYGDCYATTPNGRSAAATKAAGGDDRTFRDKPFSTVGPIYDPGGGPQGRVVANGYLKSKDLCMVPNRLAIALQEDGWWVRAEAIWAKPSPMPESVTDRPASAHEKVWLLTKSERYAYDAPAVRQGRTSGGEYPVPAGWDTGPGAHGNVHRAGRSGRGPNRQDAIAASAASAGGSSDRRMAGSNERWKQSQTPGRAKGDSFARAHKASAGGHGLSPQFREDREPVAYPRGGGRNLRNYEPAPVQVWEIAGQPFAGEFCLACRNYFERAALRALAVVEVGDDGAKARVCTCGESGRWLSHFATFPPELVERGLTAAPKHCCATCAAPWSRVVEKTFAPQSDCSAEAAERDPAGLDPSSRWGGSARGTVSFSHIGFAPTCDCPDAERAAPRVLDPFGGSGTTGMAADRLGLDCTLIELNPDYAEMAGKRIGAARPTAAVIGVASHNTLTATPLFGDVA